MRKRIQQKGTKSFSVNAVAGSYVVLLGMDANPAALKGLLGFAIHRSDKTENEQYWLAGYKTFEATMPHPAPGTLVPTHEHPVQGFIWGDYTAKPNHKYVYRVVPVYGTPRALTYGTPLEVDVTTETGETKTHGIYFNRGVAGSQAYARKFGNKSPDKAGPEAFAWLSRGLEEAIIRFIGQARGKKFAIRAAAYEFSHEKVLNAFKVAAKSGADVKIVYDSRKPDPQKTSKAAIKKAGIGTLMIPRKADPNFISHNKFIVLLENGKPSQVLTGSTNFTDGGIYGQSNVVHIVRDASVAQRYLNYWQLLASDTPAAKLRGLNLTSTPDPKSPLSSGVGTVFSPRPSLNALQWYSTSINDAKTHSLFTAAFGVNKLFAAVLAKNKANCRHVLLEKASAGDKVFLGNTHNFIARGAVLGAKVIGDSELHRWLGERLSGLNKFVKFLHTKYLLVDPLGDEPLVISGSANFSDASTKNNDENMLLISGDKTVADIYLGEFMRIWHHYHFRDIANRLAHVRADKNLGKAPGGTGKRGNNSPYLVPDDSWTKGYFGGSFGKTQERLLFRG